MRAIRHGLGRDDLSALVAGGAATVLVLLAIQHSGTKLGAGVSLGLIAFAGLVAAWLFAPHIVVGVSIPLFALLPAAKVFVSGSLGPVKDAVTLAAGVAVLVTVFRRHRRPDGTHVDSLLYWLILALGGLYLVNLGGSIAGGGHGIAWAQGFRLVCEPLILLLAGLTLPNPRRSLDVAVASLIGTGVGVALYGLYQQHIGAAGLVGMGYSYRSEVRTIGSLLRSFGSLDDPFTYAAFLFLSLGAVIFWMRRGLLAFSCATVIAFGIAVSFVRTAAVISVALIAIWIARERRAVLALILLAVSACAALTLLFAQAGASETHTVQAGPNTYITLNGRTTVWKTIFRNPAQLPFGVGVGKVGTAAQRASESISGGRASNNQASHQAVDSAYFATVADIGLLGLVVVLALFTRLIVLALAGTRAAVGSNAGWLALALLSTLLIDAITRESFNGFPTAYIGLLVVGLAIARTSQATTRPFVD
jgi:hypothetical protein